HGRGREVSLPEVGALLVRFACTPRVTLAVSSTRVVTGGLLPLSLGGQPLTGPRCVRLSFVEGHMHHWFVQPQRFDMAEPPTCPSPRFVIPEQRRVDPGALTMVPSGHAPPT